MIFLYFGDLSVGTTSPACWKFWFNPIFCFFSAGFCGIDFRIFLIASLLSNRIIGNDDSFELLSYDLFSSFWLWLLFFLNLFGVGKFSLALLWSSPIFTQSSSSLTLSRLCNLLLSFLLSPPDSHQNILEINDLFLWNCQPNCVLLVPSFHYYKRISWFFISWVFVWSHQKIIRVWRCWGLVYVLRNPNNITWLLNAHFHFYLQSILLFI